MRKSYLFDISWPTNNSHSLDQIIDYYIQIPLANRSRDDIRLDEAVRFTNINGTFYYLNFSKKRMVGPGKIGSNQVVSGVNLGNGFNFGEETTALFWSEKNAMLIIYNHYGVGVNRILEYFNAYDPVDTAYQLDFQGSPRLNPAAHAELKRMKHIEKLEITATIDALAEDQHTDGVALARASKNFGARRISFTLNANELYHKGEFLRKNKIISLARKLMKKSDSEVSVLKIKGQVGNRDKLIDLIEQKISAKFSEKDLQILHNKYTLQSKKDLLDKCLKGWINLI